MSRIEMLPCRGGRLRSLAVLVAALSAGLCGRLCPAAPEPAPPRAAGKEKPSVVLILADDLTYRDVGCYGNSQVRTPNIDGLAAGGMRFTNAFTATAMCSPTRQQLYTGVFPVRNGAYPNHSRVKPGTKSVVHHLRGLGYRVALSGKTHFGPPESFPFERAKKPEQYIEEAGAEPFCLVAAFGSPHVPWPKAEGYDPDELSVPPYLVDTPETRAALARYYTEITMLDGQVGRVLEAIERSGRAEDTMVIFTSEQGAQLPFGKWTCYDLGLRVALIVRWPGVVAPGSTSEAIVQYVDVVPTLVEAAGGDPRRCDTGLPGGPDGGRAFDGRSFLGVLSGERTEHGRYAFGVQTTKGIIDGKPYPVRSVCDRRMKYIRNLMPEATFQNYLIRQNIEGFWDSWVAAAERDEFAARRVKLYQHRPAEELYDLERDPFELTNLAERPEYREKMDALRRVLDGWMQQQGDRGVETELGYKRR